MSHSSVGGAGYTGEMNGLLDAAVEIAQFFDTNHWRYCVIGGLAVQRWGEPRTTLDADFTLLTDWGKEADFVDRILERFTARIQDARDFAISRRVLLVKSSKATPIDVSLGALPFEVEMVSRAIAIDFAPDVTLPCCTAEDLFVMKAFASRPRDWADVEGIVQRQGKLDTDYVMNHLRVLAELKEEPEIVGRAKKLLGVD